MEGALLGAFMIAACLFSVLLSHPDSPVVTWIRSADSRRMMMGICMGTTAIGLIYSPWGKQSGAHMNPAVTFAFWSMGKVNSIDAVFYSLFQIAGGLAGVAVATLLAKHFLSHAEVKYAATIPGEFGAYIAWIVEFVISFFLMLTVLHFSNHSRFDRFTGVAAGVLVATFITLAAPLSGMSMNPARTLASALPSGIWTAAWIYFTAPPLAMFLAAKLFVGFHRCGPVHCAKLHHQNKHRCIFCEFGFTPGKETIGHS
jgi:aquaporin Z